MNFLTGTDKAEGGLLMLKMTEGTWTIYQAAEYLGCSPGTLRNWTSQRRVPFRKIGRLTRFMKRDLDEWLEECRVPATDLH